MKYFQSGWIIIFLLNFTSCSHAVSNNIAKNIEKPKWVKQRPISKIHYIGIGVAQKNKTDQNHSQIAKDIALNDMSSQITVTISSEVVRKVVERSGIVEDDFRMQVQSSTKTELEGYELVATWEDSKEYWVYYRLSKALHEKIKREKISKATSLSLDIFSKAKENENAGNIEKALLFYLQSINPIEKYANNTLEVNFQGSDIYLMNEIYSSIQFLLSSIELRPVKSNIEAKIGQPLKNPVQVLAVFVDQSGREKSIANLPLKFYFSRGAGDLIENVRTNRSGRASCLVSKITATDRLQMMKADLRMNSFVNQDSVSFLISGIIKSLVVPETKFILNVSGLSVYIESQEKLFGRKLSVQHIEPALKNNLSEKGFIFIDNLAGADLKITVSAESKKGSEIYGMYSSFTDLTISVIDMNSGDEIYKNSLHDVKGIDLTYEKGGLKSLENAAKEVNRTIIPELIERIQR